MINDKDYNTDEFDKLFDDFLEEQLNKEVEDFFNKMEEIVEEIPDYYRFVSYNSRGMEYIIPKHDESPFCKIDDNINISIDDNISKMVPCETTAFFLHEIKKDTRIYLSLNNVSSYFSPKKLLLTLYKTGVPEPLEATSLNAEQCEVPIKITCDPLHYTFGDYFLLVSGAEPDSGCSCTKMGGNIRFNFSILQHGEEKETATIDKIAMSRSDSPEKETTTKSVRLDVVFDKAQTEDNEFTFCCTTSGYKNMISPEKIRPYKRRKKKISIKMMSKYIWTEETYHIYVLQNGEPFYKATFGYDGKAFTLIETKGIGKDSSEYLYMKYLLTGEYEVLWKELSRIPGVKGGKETIFSNLKAMVANKIRYDHGLRKVYTPQNYIIEFMDEKFLEHFVPLATSMSSYKKADCASLTELKYTIDPYEDCNNFIYSCDNSAMVLYNVGALLMPNGGTVLGKIENWLKSNVTHTLILCGMESECRAVIETAPFLQELFPKENIVRRENYSLTEQVHCMQDILGRYDYFTDDDSETALVEFLTDARENGDAARWRKEELEKFFKERIHPRIVERILNYRSIEEQRLKNVCVVKAEDLKFEFETNNDSEFTLSMSELNKMVGLNELKEHFEQMFNYMRMEGMRRELGLTTTPQTAHHMIFTGNPGTGKTTVAKNIGKVFHALGLLSKGEVIVTERTKLVGRYIGETERNMQRVLEQARGNVLFIDEAYTLCDNVDDRKDFGSHVIDALLTVLAQPNPDILVIMAGYKNDMARMMNANLGLEGRFPHKFHFADYTADELMQIATAMLAKNEYILEEEARATLLRGIEETLSKKSERFSNARWVEQVVMQGILPAMSSRIMKEGFAANKETLTTIKSEDVVTALEKFRIAPPANNNMRRGIGF